MRDNVYLVVARDLRGGELFSLEPVKAAFESSASVDSPAGFCHGLFRGPTEPRAAYFSLASGYSLRSLHRLPIGLNLLRYPFAEGKESPNLLSSAAKEGLRTFIAASPLIHSFFPSIWASREYMNHESSQDYQLIDLVESRLLPSSTPPSATGRVNTSLSQRSTALAMAGSFRLQMYFLGSSRVAPDHERSIAVMTGMLSTLMGHVEEEGGLLVALSLQLREEHDRIGLHDFLFYGPRVRNALWDKEENLSCDDITATLSFVLGLAQPASCLGMPISNIYKSLHGRRRLTYVRQVEQENYRQLDLLLAKRFAEDPFRRGSLFSGAVRVSNEEADFLASRRASLRRRDLPKLIEKRMAELSGSKERQGLESKGKWALALLLLMPSLSILVFALAFAPSLWQCLVFAIYFFSSQFFGLYFFYESSSTRIWSLLAGGAWLSSSFLFILPLAAVLFWILLGRFFKWNGLTS